MVDVLGIPMETWMLYLPILAGLVGVIAVGILFYVFYLKPKMEEPLPNEQLLGHLSIYLQGYGYHTGPWCTAQATVDRAFKEIMEACTAESTSQSLADAARFMRDYHPYAHRVGQETFIYLFDSNPEDSKFRDVDPNYENGCVIHGVQEVLPAGDWNGWKFLGISLNPETKVLDMEGRKRMTACLSIIKYIKDAARMSTKYRVVAEENAYLKDALDKVEKERAATSAKLDRCKSALAAKNLTQPEEVKIPGELRAKLKEWFQWYQPFTALAAYLIAPYIVSALNLGLEPPVLTYFVAVITALGFFIVPIGKKLLGRWI